MSWVVVFVLLVAAAALLNQKGVMQHRLWHRRGASSAADEDGCADPNDAVGIRDPALMLDLAAAMLEAGQPVESVLNILARPCTPGVRTAVRRAAAALGLGAQWDAAWDLAAEGIPRAEREVVIELAAALTFAASTGAPSAQLLYAHAAQYRRRRNRAAEQRAASLGVKLVVPLGVCALPAFVCLGIMPVLFALVPALG